jgi:hypothetical protein
MNIWWRVKNARLLYTTRHRQRRNNVEEWISVNDRLPVDMVTVLIAHKGGVSFGWYNGVYWTKGAATKHRPIKTVTHWMPLPGPPKKEDNVT